MDTRNLKGKAMTISSGYNMPPGCFDVPGEFPDDKTEQLMVDFESELDELIAKYKNLGLSLETIRSIIK